MKKIIFVFLSSLWLVYTCAFSYAQVLPGIRHREIAMIIAKKNFRDEELLIPKYIFESAGYKVRIFSSSFGTAKGVFGASVSVYNTIDKLEINNYNAVVFVGGPGAVEYWDNRYAHKAIREAVAGNKVLGAICIAPVTLARAGALKGRRATVWASERKKIEEKGAIYTGRDVEISGNIVTANKPQNAARFAEAIIDLLKK